MSEVNSLSRLWILRLVPDIRFGRWLCFAGLFLLMFVFLESAGLLLGGYNDSWPIALFFACIIAYIVPVFHFVTQRSQAALEELQLNGLIEPDHARRLRQAVSHRGWRWLLFNLTAATALWFTQSWIITGSIAQTVDSLVRSYPSFVASVAPLMVWLTMTCVVHALVDNARMFRNLAASIEIDVFDGHGLIPFGRMAVSSTLIVFGAQALFSIMWLGGDISPWTTIPGLVPTSIALVYLFVAPIWPIHQRLKSAKQAQLAQVQHQIRTLARPISADSPQLVTLLTVRREISALPEWPMDIGVMTRFSLYLVIVPLTWIGAALIENVVDFFIA
ncbi:MAG: hypothetical protein ACFHXK_06540 [bacterium]